MNYDLLELSTFLDQYGQFLGLDQEATNPRLRLPACWDQHPEVIFDLIGLANAWEALDDAIENATYQVAPRDHLDLANSSDTAIRRIRDNLTGCAARHSTNRSQ